MQPLISICVPVYNVAPYIERCVHSLMQQTYENLEYIFVDDCSTDNSVSVLQKVITGYPYRTDQVRILHNDRNHGLAYTRRVSIEAAKGEYILCVDSDDYLDRDATEKLYRSCSGNCDIVFGTIYGEKIELSDQSNLLQALLEDRICHLCGNLIKRSLFSLPSVQYVPEGLNYMEDRTQMLYLCGAAKNFNVLHEPIYHYVQHEKSVSYNKKESHIKNMLSFWGLADKYLEQYRVSNTYQRLTNKRKIEDKIHLLHFCDDISVCRKYADIFPEAEKTNPRLQLPRGKRLTRFLMKYHLWGLLWLYKHFSLR